MPLKINGHWFTDNEGNKLLLRGVNLGQSTKIPLGGETHLKSDFSNHNNVSFVNRPFPIEESDEHFSRLKNWGFNCIRFLTTWEAIEHTGPNVYDTVYLNYLQQIIKIAGDYGFYIFIDPHQDVWSRMTGGDGAPGWIFEKIGLDFSNFGPSESARLMQYNYPEDYQQMEWAFNYQKFATSTMFTLFFGGKDFAENCIIENQNIQDYLQTHFINAIKQIAQRVKDFDHVIGFDSMNEPNKGWIGYKDIKILPELTPPGKVYSPFDAMVAGSGFSRVVPIYALKLFRLRKVGNGILNENEISNWISDEYDIWKNHGIWEIKNNRPKLLKPNYFWKNKNGESADFQRDYLHPFILNYIKEIRETNESYTIFIEAEPETSRLYWDKNGPSNIVNASHWYDGFTLFTKSFRNWLNVDVETAKIIITKKKVKEYFKNKLGDRLKMSKNIQNEIPTLIGEFGIPYDMNKKKSYKTGNYKKQVQALSLYYDAIDELQLHSTQWNYTSDNNNEWGDLWNMEDLSIFSRSQQDDPSEINSGGRAIEGFCRPHPIKISGDPLYWKFDRKRKQFEFVYLNRFQSGTEIYIPKILFPKPKIEIIDRSSSVNIFNFKLQNQILTLIWNKDSEIQIKVQN